MRGTEIDARIAELAAAPRTRRDVARLAGGLAAAAALSRLPLAPAAAAAPITFASDPFALGVASGDPAPTDVLLWTRLAPQPLQADGGLPARPVDVRWELALDEDMRKVVRRGTATAYPSLAHSLHVQVDGLTPRREYHYRFTVGDAASAVGRARTAPSPDAQVRAMRYGIVSCQAWDDGYYPVLRDLAEQDVDFVFHLGDYIYEGPIQAGKVPRDPQLPAELGPEATTLDQYRLRHALYKTDTDLRAVHARHPFAVTWDDHDVVNDYAGTDPALVQRKAAAYRAYYEHLPLRAAALPKQPELPIYRRLRWGDLATFQILDTRQYRSLQPCGDGESPRCAAALDPRKTLTGPAQERWLLKGLDRSRARWNVIAQQVLMAELDHDVDPAAKVFWNDAWDGYPAARSRILQHLRSRRIANPLVLTGDWHSTFANDVKLDFDDPRSPTVATEFVCPSITTGGDNTPYGPYYGPMVPYNPHIRFFDGDRRGSLIATMGRRTTEVEWRVAKNVASRDAPVWPLRRFHVEAGRPGVQL